VRVRDHVVLASGAAALLFPSVGASVVVPWAASIFIDVDHYLWFLARHRRLNPVAAVRLYNSANAPQHQATRPFHHPGFAVLLLLLSRRKRAAVLPVTGMAFHLSLDAYHRARMADAKATALIRDQFTCQICGASGPNIVAHLWRQPRVLPSYSVEHLVAVCDECHQSAHARGAVAIAGLECEWESYRADVARRLHAKPLRVESGHEVRAGVHATVSRPEWGARSMM
jgi:hypothetical protein